MEGRLTHAPVNSSRHCHIECIHVECTETVNPVAITDTPVGDSAAVRPGRIRHVFDHWPRSQSGQLGMAVQSKTIAVGSRTRSGKAGVAVIAHQSASNPMYGAIGIELLQAGMTPQQALDMMLRSDKGRNSRQVAILEAQGRTAA